MSNSRENILAAINANKPAPVELPEIPLFERRGNLVNVFIGALEFIGATSVKVTSLSEVDEYLESLQQAGTRLVNTIAELNGYNINAYKKANASELEALDTAFIKGQVGVAENGAIWVSESDMVNRLFPFICRKLVLVINAKDIVYNMHEAYRRIQVDEDGYGTFIAGPSKTADIEQSLVVGAHGPLELKVFIVS